uniref:Uncharacterized protein n=1 Tax=Wuchereria bancrofti TaxID=6293 RepID=A0AAF5PHU8_WUCBA
MFTYQRNGGGSRWKKRPAGKMVVCNVHQTIRRTFVNGIYSVTGYVPSVMSLTPLYQSFPVFFFIMNEESVWAAGTFHFDERTMFSGDSNENSVFKVLNSITMKRVHRDVGVLGTPFVGAFVTGIIEKRYVRMKKDAEPVIEAVLHGVIGTLVISFRSGCCK